MSINDILEKIKPFYSLFLVLIIASIFFALGRLSAREEAKTPLKIEYKAPTMSSEVSTSNKVNNEPNVATVVTAQLKSGEVIGSKSGKKYYYPWCGTVKRIKPENQVHFDSIEDAKAAGFTPGGNCKGLN